MSELASGELPPADDVDTRGLRSRPLDELRGQFPALERVVYLNTPTASPGARPVLDALHRVEREWEDGVFSWQAWEGEGHATRQLFGDLVGVPPERVALMASLSQAAATVAASLAPGRVVVGSREFQSNLFPWLALSERGSEVVEVPERDGVVPTDAILEATVEGTSLVAVSEVQSANGYRVDVPAIAERCRQVGARLFVNGTQSLGAVRLAADARPDFVAAHGYKWLCAPRGAAWLAVRDDLARLRPLAPNWKSVPEPYAEYYGGPMVLASGASKLDASLAWFPWVGAKAALDLLASFDPSEVETRALGLAAAFRDEARARGFRVVPVERPTPIVALDVPDPRGLRLRLIERGVIGAVRGGSLRLGFHAYNAETDVEAALEALGRP